MELLEMAKKSQSHQHEIDKEEQRIHASYLERHHKLFGRGQIIAGILGVTALVGGTIIAATKSPEFGSGIIGATMAAIAGSFIWSNWNKGKKEE